MRHIAVSLATLLLGALFVAGQQQVPVQQSKPAARGDLYHVHFVKAAPGKTQELLESLKTPDPNAPMPGHALVLRHLQGDDWDFAVIEHLGPKATLDAAGMRITSARELRAWHNDTFATGPAWAEFAKAMGITPQQGEAAPSKAVYILTTYRGAAGHRAQLEQTLNRIMASSKNPAENVLLQHAEGSPWDYVLIARYDSWQDLASQEDDPGAEARERKAGFTQSPGLELREHMAGHNDTIAERVDVGQK